MTAVDIRSVGVLGAGTMGQGIARVSAGAGLETCLFDVNDDLISRGMTAIQQGLDREVEKGKLAPEQRTEFLQRIKPCRTLQELNADIVIEAVIEKLDVKQELFGQIEQFSLEKGRQVILATNTSSLSVSAIAQGLRFPGRCIGLHFFNPAPVMNLVEVVAGEKTDSSCVFQMTEFVKRLGKTPALTKDSPGFIVNRVARHYYVESLKLLEDAVCPVPGIDRLMRSAGFKMGPFELMDLIGIDTNFTVTSSLYLAFNKAVRFKPSPIQQEKVNTGALGRKSGKGFYDYEKN